ncbi:MAG TPA: hypothetical protein VK787_14275 [Puia sp.]|jgi:hypothetical protein|nr:hypothetical protein [Puia sp.]
MLKDYFQLRTLSLIIIGDFNPAIIQPFWLAKKGLIKEQEANSAKVEIVHPQLTRYDLDWVFLEISENRFVFNSSKEPFFDIVRDLVSGIFTFLPETPISAIGINHLLHYTLPREEQYLELGNRLTPLRNWENVLDDPKLLELNITEQKRRDKHKGHYAVKIQPSELVPKYGVLFSINDHLALEEGETGRETELIKRLNLIWNESKERPERVVEQLWTNLNI